MTVNKIKFAPGAEISVIPTDKFKSNYFSLNFYIPLDKKIASEVSLLSRVMTRGTVDHPSIGELNLYTDMLYELTFGMNVSALGIYQVLSFTMDYIGDRYVPAWEKESISESAMNFMREFFLRPLVKDGAFCEEFVESEKKIVSDAIRGEINNKDSYAAKRAKRHLIGDHPAAISPIGDLEVVSELNGAILYQRFLKILAEARVEVVFVGDASGGVVDSIVSALRDILPADRFDTAMPEPTKCFDADGDDVREIVEDIDTKQSRMILGYSLPYDVTQSHIASVFLEIFSNSPVSRLFVNIRERMNLCYYCTAGLDAFTGAMTIRSGMSKKNVDAARVEITRQLDDVASGNISEDELDVSKLAIISSIKSVMDSASGLAEWYLRRLIRGCGFDLEELMEKISQVSSDEVAGFAARAKLKMAYLLRGEEA